jgi:hypothetical protein
MILSKYHTVPVLKLEHELTGFVVSGSVRLFQALKYSKRDSSEGFNPPLRPAK